jgi:hypothetical protein
VRELRERAPHGREVLPRLRRTARCARARAGAILTASALAWRPAKVVWSEVTTMAEQRFCTACGQGVQAGDEFCTGCGGAIEPAAAAPTTAVPVEPQVAAPKPKWRRRLAWAFAVVCALLALAAWTIVSMTNQVAERRAQFAAAAAASATPPSSPTPAGTAPDGSAATDGAGDRATPREPPAARATTQADASQPASSDGFNLLGIPEGPAGDRYLDDLSFSPASRPADATAEALRYYTGDGVSADLVRARQAFEQLAATDGLAAYFLSQMCDRGEGGPRDVDAGLRWLVHGAALGHADSQYRLGLRYARGMEGMLQPDLAQADRLLDAAAAQGHHGAAVALEQLRQGR